MGTATDYECAACGVRFAGLQSFDKHQDVDYQRTPAVVCRDASRLDLIFDHIAGRWGTTSGDAQRLRVVYMRRFSPPGQHGGGRRRVPLAARHIQTRPVRRAVRIPQCYPGPREGRIFDLRAEKVARRIASRTSRTGSCARIAAVRGVSPFRQRVSRNVVNVQAHACSCARARKNSRRWAIHAAGSSSWASAPFYQPCERACSPGRVASTAILVRTN